MNIWQSVVQQEVFLFCKEFLQYTSLVKSSGFVVLLPEASG